MRKPSSVLILLISFVLLLTSFAPAASAAEIDSQTTREAAAAAAVDTQSAFEDEVIRLTNAERAKHGLWPLRKNTPLTQAARGHAQDMIAHDFASHRGSNGSSSADRARAAGYQPYGWGAAYVGENIAAGVHTPADAVNAWLNSPAHKANMLRPEYREIGVGMVKGGRYGTYWVQNFGAAPKVFPAFLGQGAGGQATLTITHETVSPWGSTGPAVQMMVANDESFRGAVWQPYQRTISWQAPADAGAKVVHIRLRDAAGNVTYTQATSGL